MTPDDVRLTAQLVVDKRVNCVTDESVMALAQRVLELEELLRVDMTYSERLSIGVLKARAQQAEAERDMAQRAAAHWEGVAAAIITAAPLRVLTNPGLVTDDEGLT